MSTISARSAMATPATYSETGSTISSYVNTITVPVLNTSLKGINIATVNANNGFLDININALTGPNSSISIVKPGSAPTITLTGLVKKSIRIGSDPSNRLPFIGKQSINIIFNAAPNESILVSQLSYKSGGLKNKDYKKIAFIFLAVYFVINMFV